LKLKFDKLLKECCYLNVCFSDEEIDLQLPVDAYKVEQKIIIANEPKIKFREKKVTSLVGTTVGGPSVGFRKPKAGIQRSIRTAENTDES